MARALARLRNLRSTPETPYEGLPIPPAPDYGTGEAWFAWPGRASLARTPPPGLSACDEEAARVDAFFIHPTTYLRNDVWNAAFDARGHLDVAVQRYQMTVFNGSCRLYAPRYRQASLAAQGRGVSPAIELAYRDVLAAFEFYLERYNAGRPFVLASHSQGTLHLVRMLQQRIFGTPLQRQLVVAYAVGGFLPEELASRGIPIGDGPRALGCAVGWNTFNHRARYLPPLYRPRVWWEGAFRDSRELRNTCVNPLTWTRHSAVPAKENRGALPANREGTLVAPLVPHLTGAVCRGERLEVHVPRARRNEGFTDLLSQLGSYHVFDYNLFYANIRANVADRIEAFLAG